MRSLIILTTVLAMGSSPLANAAKMPAEMNQHPLVAIIEAQESAWNNGDLAEFMNGYWQSEQLAFIGSEAISYGWDETLARYRQRYPDRATMGELQFEVLELIEISEDYAWLLGNWRLTREDDHPSGHFTLLWQRIDDKWVIIRDHSS